MRWSSISASASAIALRSARATPTPMRPIIRSASTPRLRTASSARCRSSPSPRPGNERQRFVHHRRRQPPKFVHQAGTFLNGPDRDKGPSDLSIDHVFQLNGLVELPYQFLISGIFRAQSGFHFSRQPAAGQLVDPDGDSSVNAIDIDAGRNAFTAPAFVNLDMRVSKRFGIGGRAKAEVLSSSSTYSIARTRPRSGAGRMCRSSLSAADTGAARPRGADRFQNRVLTSHLQGFAAATRRPLRWTRAPAPTPARIRSGGCTCTCGESPR